MLDVVTKNRINTARDILVGKVPDPKSQVEQITIALIYKFMDDMDTESEELGGKRSFFAGKFAKYAWRKIFDPRLSGHELLNLYSEAIGTMNTNPGISTLFRDIFKNAYLPYRDPETLKSFLKIINEFDYSHSEKLGDAFEFILSVLGSQGNAGQFRTPRHIIDFMIEIVDPKKDETILDPACGTAGFLISSYRHIIRQNSSNYNPDEHNNAASNGDQSVADRIISTNGYTGDKLSAEERKTLARNIRGYDISPDMVRLSLVNMYLHGIKDPKISEYDTLTSEDNWNYFSDVILANPPFMSPKGGIRPHKRFSVQSNRSEVLFVDYIMEHLTPNGRAAVIVPEGIIFQSGKAYKELRKKLVNDCLVGVISLPAGVFNPYSGVKTSILWLDKTLAKKTDKVLFVKIENDGFDLGAQRRAIKGNDLPIVSQHISAYKSMLVGGKQTENESVADISLVPRNDISVNDDFNLSGERYRKILKIDSAFKLVNLEDPFIEIRNGINVSQTDEIGKYRVTRIETISNGTIDLKKVKWTNDIVSPDRIMQHGDILLSHINSYDHLAKSALYETETDNVIHGINLVRFRPDKEKINPVYAKYILKSPQFIDKAKSFAQRAVNQASIRVSDLKSIQIPLPPLLVQEEIVLEIDGYQKIIDGARQVVENYKPRIEIDPEWEMVELGELFSKVNESVLPIDLDVSEINYIGLENISQGSGELVGKILVDPKGIKSTKTVFKVGDVLYGKLRPNLNKVYYSQTNGICSTDIFVLRGSEEVSSKLYSYYFLSQEFNAEVLKSIKGAQLPRVGFTDFAKILIPLPPKGKQQEIVENIDQEQGIVRSNSTLINIYEQKIKDRIAKVWGE